MSRWTTSSTTSCGARSSRPSSGSAKDITDSVQAAWHDDLRRIRLVEALTPHVTNPATRSVLAWEAMLAVEALDSELTDTRLAQAFRLLADVWAEARAGGS
jgi:hypothetical protein